MIPNRFGLVAAAAVLLGLAACRGEERENAIQGGAEAGTETRGTLEEAVVPDSLEEIGPAPE